MKTVLSRSGTVIWLITGTLLGMCSPHPLPQSISPEQGSDIRPKILARGATGHESGRQVTLIATSESDIKLSSEPVVVPLRSAQQARSLAWEMQSYLARNNRLYLILKHIRAAKQPGVLFHVYLDLPRGTRPDREDPRHVGVLNFFEAVAPSDSDPRADNVGRDFTYEITDLVRILRSKNLLTSSGSVTIIPTKDFPSDVQPSIGQFAIAVQ